MRMGTTPQSVQYNDVNGSSQVVANQGGVDITGNRVGGNLQCKENTPPPTHGANVVQGNAEDQCAGPAGGQPGSGGPRAGSAPAGGAACSAS